MVQSLWALVLLSVTEHMEFQHWFRSWRSLLSVLRLVIEMRLRPLEQKVRFLCVKTLYSLSTDFIWLIGLLNSGLL